MDTRTKPKMPLAGYPLYFAPGEQALIKGRNDPALAQEFQRMMSQRVAAVILRYHEGAGSADVNITRLNSPENTPKHWGLLLEVLYQIAGKPGSYRHVFHLMLTDGGLGGQLFTQSRRRIAK